MDGEAIAEAFATCSGPDCLKDILPKFGQRVKVYNAIKLSLGVEMASEVIHYYTVSHVCIVINHNSTMYGIM